VLQAATTFEDLRVERDGLGPELGARPRGAATRRRCAPPRRAPRRGRRALAGAARGSGRPAPGGLAVLASQVEPQVARRGGRGFHGRSPAGTLGLRATAPLGDCTSHLDIKGDGWLARRQLTGARSQGAVRSRREPPPEAHAELGGGGPRRTLEPGRRRTDRGGPDADLRLARRARAGHALPLRGQVKADSPGSPRPRGARVGDRPRGRRRPPRETARAGLIIGADEATLDLAVPAREAKLPSARSASSRTSRSASGWSLHGTDFKADLARAGVPNRCVNARIDAEAVARRLAGRIPWRLTASA